MSECGYSMTYKSPRDKRPQSNHFVFLVVCTFHKSITGTTAKMMSEIAAEADTISDQVLRYFG